MHDKSVHIFPQEVLWEVRGHENGLRHEVRGEVHEMDMDMIDSAHVTLRARDEEKGRLCQEFWDAHQEFKNKTGVYAESYIWKLAED